MKEGNVLFNDALNTFYLRLYGVRPAKHLSIGCLKTRSGLEPVPRCEPTGRKEMFYLTTHSTHFIYGYMAYDI